jgi:Ni,Fe-hydrogenase I large subunit
MKTALFALAIAVAAVPALAATKLKAPTPATKPLCAEGVCTTFHQKASIAIQDVKLDVILLREDEYQRKIPSAADAVMAKTKATRAAIQPLYDAALKSVASSPTATAAMKNYMKAWTSALNSYPMQTLKERSERDAENQAYEARLNDAWAEVQVETGAE